MKTLTERPLLNDLDWSFQTIVIVCSLPSKLFLRTKMEQGICTVCIYNCLPFSLVWDQSYVVSLQKRSRQPRNENDVPIFSSPLAWNTLGLSWTRFLALWASLTLEGDTRDCGTDLEQLLGSDWPSSGFSRTDQRNMGENISYGIWTLGTKQTYAR